MKDFIFTLIGMSLIILTMSSLFCMFSHFGVIGEFIIYIIAGVGLFFSFFIVVDMENFKKANGKDKLPYLIAYLVLVAIFILIIFLARIVAFEFGFCKSVVEFGNNILIKVVNNY